MLLYVLCHVMLLLCLQFAAMLRFEQRQSDQGYSESDSTIATHHYSESDSTIGNSKTPTFRFKLRLSSQTLTVETLRLFLRFLYTGVLDTSMDTYVLMELATVADEFLVRSQCNRKLNHLCTCISRRHLVLNNCPPCIEAAFDHATTH